MINFRLRYERLRDGYRAFVRHRAFIRGAWLGLVVPIAGLILQAGAGLPSSPWLWWLGAFAVLSVAWWRLAAGQTPRDLGESLDRQLKLDALLVTALEVDLRGPEGPVEHRLLDDAATVLAQLGDLRPLLADQIRRERETLLGVALLLAGVWLVAGSRQSLPPTELLASFGDQVASQHNPAGAGGEGEGEHGQSTGAAGNNGSAAQSGPGTASEADRRLAEALADEAAARPFADALSRGDKSEAQAELQRLAGATAGLSASGRQGLAESLFDAADAAQPQNREMAEALRRAGRALERPDTTGDAEGLAAMAAALAAPAAGAGPPAATSRPARVSAGPPAARLGPSAYPTETLRAANEGPRSRSASSQRSAGDRLPAEAPGNPNDSAGEPPEGPAASGGDALMAPLGWQGALGRYFQVP